MKLQTQAYLATISRSLRVRKICAFWHCGQVKFTLPGVFVVWLPSEEWVIYGSDRLSVFKDCDVVSVLPYVYKTLSTGRAIAISGDYLMQCSKCHTEMSKKGNLLHSGNSHFQQYQCASCHATSMQAVGLVGGMPK